MSKLLKRSLIGFGFITLFVAAFITINSNRNYFPHFEKKLKEKSTPTACKNLKSLSVSISSVGKIPDLNSERIFLKASLRPLSFNSDQIYYKWNLPEGAHILSGDVEGYIKGTNPSQSHEVFLELTGFSKEEFKQISISAHLQKDGVNRQMSSAILSSDPTKTWENYGIQMSSLRE